MKKARIVLVDCPWAFNNRHDTRSDNPGHKTKFGTGVAHRYGNGTMSDGELIALGPSIKSICAEDALIFSWATCSTLDSHMDVMRGMGFSYTTCGFVWEKINTDGTPFFGPGRYTGSNAELCTIWRVDRKRKLWFPNTGYTPSQIVRARHPRGSDSKVIHSRKPDDVHDRISRWLDPHLDGCGKVELFATRQYPAHEEYLPWICLGGDVTGNDITDDLDWLAVQMRRG